MGFFQVHNQRLLFQSFKTVFQSLSFHLEFIFFILHSTGLKFYRKAYHILHIAYGYRQEIIIIAVSLVDTGTILLCQFFNFFHPWIIVKPSLLFLISGMIQFFSLVQQVIAVHLFPFFILFLALFPLIKITHYRKNCSQQCGQCREHHKRSHLHKNSDYHSNCRHNNRRHNHLHQTGFTHAGFFRWILYFNPVFWNPLDDTRRTLIVREAFKFIAFSPNL